MTNGNHILSKLAYLVEYCRLLTAEPYKYIRKDYYSSNFTGGIPKQDEGTKVVEFLEEIDNERGQILLRFIVYLIRFYQQTRYQKL